MPKRAAVLATTRIAVQGQLVAAGDSHRPARRRRRAADKPRSRAAWPRWARRRLGARSAPSDRGRRKNTGPAARITATRSLAPGGSVKAACSCAIISASSALRLSGRFEEARCGWRPSTCHVTLTMPPHSTLMLVSRISSAQRLVSSARCCAISSGVCGGNRDVHGEQLCPHCRRSWRSRPSFALSLPTISRGRVAAGPRIEYQLGT